MKLKYFFLTIVILLILISIYFSSKSQIATLIQNNKNITLLLIGTDWVDYSQHSDTIIFINYNIRDKLLDLLSIPRDTSISLEDIPVKQINQVYTFYFHKTKNHNIASTQLLNTVSGIFSNKLQIPYYIQINYTFFTKLIDKIDGIKITIDEPMHYDDKAGNLHIHFQPGNYSLSGNKALEYVRYRSSSGDIGRIYRQQKFFRAFLKKFINPIYIIRIPTIFHLVSKESNTNMGIWDMLNLILELKNIKLKNIRMAQLPGKSYGTRWFVDEQEINRVVELFSGKIPVPKMERNLLVEVYNASDISGIALQLTQKLRNAGFDVMYYGNYSTKQNNSMVIDRIGNLHTAQKIAKILNIDEIITRYDSNKIIDITVIIGQNYKLKGRWIDE